MRDNLRLDFENLPLVEAAVRASFANPIDLRFSAINAVHTRLRESFPEVAEPQQYEAAPGVTDELAIHPGVITGALLTGNPCGLRCTLQKRVAVVRWLKQLTSDAPAYPRYSALRKAMWELIDAIAAGFDLDSLPIQVVNMSYVNAIQVADFGSVLVDYFSEEVQVAATAGADQIHKVEFAWHKEDLDLRFSLQKVTHEREGKTMDICRLTTAAGMQVSPGNDDPEDALDNVHNQLQIFFRKILSEQAKIEWKLSKVPNA